MSNGHLTERQIEILQYLRDKVTNGKNRLLDQVLSSTLPKSDIETVCQMINDEYLMKGIKEDYTPNEYGRELEELLDVVNRPRLA
jgi:hypothetical protein